YTTLCRSLGPALVEEARGPRAHIAEALDRAALAAELAGAEVGEHLLERPDHAAARRVLAPSRAEEVHRLAGDHRGGEAVDGGVLVHDPGHDLGIGVDVRSGDVPLRPDDVVDLLHEAPG